MTCVRPGCGHIDSAHAPNPARAYCLHPSCECTGLELIWPEPMRGRCQSCGRDYEVDLVYGEVRR